MEPISKSVEPKPKVISYIRWSTGGQKLGDSERRQVEAASEWLRENGYDPDPNEVLEDSGLSGYHSENFGENGALGKFILRVKNGQYPEGTVLVIEDFSRFSRSQVRLAQQRFLELINNGIRVVIVKDRKEYNSENYQFADMIVSLANMQAAHEESDRKSNHLKKFWKGRRQEALKHANEEKTMYPVLLPSNSPDWLRKITINGQKYFEVIEERRDVIERIFWLADKGGNDGLGLGSTRIVRVLEQEGVKPFKGEKQNMAKSFNDSYILRLLNDRRVLGELQPYKNPINEETGKRFRIKDGDPIPNYFPPIIEEQLYDRVREKREQRKNYRQGKVSSTFRNLFTNLVKCRYCGSSMTLFQKRGSRAEGGKCDYLQCSEGTKLRNCQNRAVRYLDTLEKTLIAVLLELDLSPLFKANTEKDDRKKIDIRNEIHKYQKRLDEIQNEILNVTRLQVKNPNDDSFHVVKEELMEEKNTLNELIEKLSYELNTMGRHHNYTEFKNNLEFVLSSTMLEDEMEIYNKRRAINTYLMDIIQYISVDSKNKECWVVFELGYVKEELLASFQRGQDMLKSGQIGIPMKPEYENLKIGDIAPDDGSYIPTESEIRAFGTEAMNAHLRIKLHRFNAYEPDSMDVEILREAFPVAPPELIKINQTMNKAINRTWKRFKNKTYKVLDLKSYENLKNSLFDDELLKSITDNKEA